MKLQFGIIGLGQSGKTTVFNSLCSAHASVGDYSSTKTANIAVVKVPDERLEKTAEISNSATKVYAEIEFIDIAGMSAKAIKDKVEIDSLLKEGSYIQQLRMSQALLVVIRCFEDENVPHPKGAVNPARDIIEVESELMLIDLVQIEKDLKLYFITLK